MSYSSEGIQSAYAVGEAEEFKGDSSIIIAGEEFGRGLDPRDFTAIPHGSLPCAPPFPLKKIPRSEWAERIRDMERSKSRLSDLVRFYKLQALSQGRTNYCWANGPINCMRVIRALSEDDPIDLSPASVAAPITKYRNVGGWPSKAVEYIAAKGVLPTSMWPANEINDDLAKPENAAARAKNQIDEWWDCKPESFDEQMTCVLSRVPFAGAVMRMMHVMAGIDPVVDGKRFGIRNWNSWGQQYGDGGMCIVWEDWDVATEAVAPRVATA